MIKIRKYSKRGKSGWEVDIRFEWPDGHRYRERVKSPVTSESGSQRWAEARFQNLLAAGRVGLEEKEGKQQRQRQIPTVEQFIPRFIEQHCRAERRKPSTIQANKQVLEGNIAPRIGSKPLDQVSNSDIQRIKAELADKSPKTVNNSLNALNVMLKKAVEWGVIDVMPCTIKLLKVVHDEADFYDFADYERLVAAAERVDPRIHIAVLLAGDAGFRVGEVVALEWGRVNFPRGVVVVAQSDWCGQVCAPKGGRHREVKLTQRLLRALKAFRHLQSERVLGLEGGMPLRQKSLRNWMRSAQRLAGLPQTGRFHILRHSFCAHLAMRGAPAKAIQELAGHADLTTTMRYMHLSPAARDSAIGLLEAGHLAPVRGDIVETRLAE